MDATGTAATTTPGAGVAESGVRTAAPQGVEREIAVNRERATEVAYLQSLPWYKKVCVIFITPLKTCKFNASLPARGYCRSRDLKRPKTSLFSASPPTTERHVQHRPSTRKVNLGMSAGGEPQIHTDGRVTLVGANAGFARMFTTFDFDLKIGVNCDLGYCVVASPLCFGPRSVRLRSPQAGQAKCPPRMDADGREYGGVVFMICR
jgi:hypothetical protein